jgi:hypothetical protein
MIEEKHIRNILLGGLLIALMFYHGLTLIQEKFLNIDSNHWTSLMTIARYLVTATFLFLTLRFKFIVKLILGRAYVEDSYQGISKQTENPNNIDHHETFEISQTILSTRISGRTNLKAGSTVSNWKGSLIYYDNDKEFRFAIELQTSNGTKWGIMTLRIHEGKVSGFYFPTETNETNYISTIEGMTKKKLDDIRKKKTTTA